jgi:Tfp pilus assembly protein PilO
MAEQKMNLHIPQQSIIYILLCLTGILIFILGGIIPNSKKMTEMDTKTAEAKFRLEEQKALGSFHQSLQDKNEKKESEVLPLPAKGVLAKAKLNTLPANLTTAAKTSGMSLVSATPNLNTITGDAQFISVNVILRGEFINFRKFLINLGGIPYVQHIEEIQIEEKPDTREFRMKVWVAVG